MIAKGAHPAVVVPVTSPETGQELIVQFGHSSQKGTPQVVVCFEVIAGPHSGDRISWIGYFTDKATKRTLEALRICGFKGDDLDAFNDQKPENEVQIVVEHEEKDGTVYAKVAWVNDPRRGGLVLANPMDSKARRMFSAQFKNQLKSIPAVDGKKAERQPRSAASPAPSESGWSGNDAADPPKAREFDQSPPAGADDDIPF